MTLIQEAANALGQISEPESIPALILALNHEDYEVWHAAAEALWLMDAEAEPFLRAGLIDPSMAMRRAALKAVMWLTLEHDEDGARANEVDIWPAMWGWWN
jgi:HEAT repeat protein